MSSLNRVMIIGNVVTDPEMRFTPSGVPMISFRVETSRVYISKGEQKKEVEWFNVIAWRKQAESCNQFLTRGQQVYVEGSLRTYSWEGKDGRKRITIEVIANRVMFLDKQTTFSEEVPTEIGMEVES